MPLPVNTPAPDFTLPSTEGNNFTLSRHAPGQPLILYFYPKDFTTVCTSEACEFRNQFDFFSGLEISIRGISRDSLETHQRFRQQYQLPFHLLSDLDGQIAARYKATVPFLNLTRRITYLLDRQHRIVHVFEKMFGSRAHIDEMVKSVKSLP